MSAGYRYEGLIQQLITGFDPQQLQACLELIKELRDYDETEVYEGYQSVVIKNSENLKKAIEYAKELNQRALELLIDPQHACADLESVYWGTLLLCAPYDFDSFCLYIERKRDNSKKFYQPRRKQLKQIADALQRLEDGDISLLAISLPPGVGKTTLAIFYLCWVAGKHSELQNLVGSHNNEFLRGVYDEILRILTPGGEYAWHDVFPTLGVSGTNAKDLRIDVGRRKRFQTIELTSLNSENAGKVRATNLLYCDDLCEGIEQALSKDQMDKLWSKYTVDLRQRMQGDCVRELHIQTRWSINDVVGRLQDIYAGNPKAEFINIPALDENGESNFQYPYGVGFTTEMYDDLRNSMDDASWRALYMGEPIEREGQLYAPDELRRYFELPEREPDAILAVCDTKEQGDDYCVMPIAYQYGNDYYIDSFICDNGKPEHLRERIVNTLCEKKVQMARFESNRGGSIFAQTVQTALKEKGSHCKITTRWNQTNKETRILVASAWIKEHCLFKDESLYAKEQKEYRTAMEFLCGYTMLGKNKHDDVPDAMADLEDFVRSFAGNVVEVHRRMF